MANLNGGELLVRMLDRAGVREIFTLHGGHLDAIFQAARDRDFRFVDTRHEQAAAHAADGWARTTGKPGVAIVTAGPGITDAVTGVANAWLDCIPMLLIGGAAPLRDAETLPLQGGFDQLALFTPITKWAQRVTHTERIPDLVAQALRIATTGRPGPVYLEVPIDVLFASVDEQKVSFPEQFLGPSSGCRPPKGQSSSRAAARGSRAPARSSSRSPSVPTSPSSQMARRTDSFPRTTPCPGAGSPTWCRCG
jgi:acetolactate synthase-1/2/3 large subunit